MAQRIEEGKHLHPALTLQVGSGHQLPYADASFDLVTCFVLFSSIFSDALCHSIAEEMWRVRKPNGLLLFYDFIYSNPRNTAVRGVPVQQVKRFFDHPNAHFDVQHITLAPPIARMIAPNMYSFAFLLERLRLLNTHVLVVVSEA